MEGMLKYSPVTKHAVSTEGFKVHSKREKWTGKTHLSIMTYVWSFQQHAAMKCEKREKRIENRAKIHDNF